MIGKHFRPIGGVHTRISFPVVSLQMIGGRSNEIHESYVFPDIDLLEAQEFFLVIKNNIGKFELLPDCSRRKIGTILIRSASTKLVSHFGFSPWGPASKNGNIQKQLTPDFVATFLVDENLVSYF